MIYHIFYYLIYTHCIILYTQIEIIIFFVRSDDSCNLNKSTIYNEFKFVK